MYEEPTVFKINEVPQVLNLLGHNFVLFGLLAFLPPLSVNDTGHYTALIRINNRWETFDDLRSKSYPVSSTMHIIIHCIFYVKFDTVNREVSLLCTSF